MWECPQWNKCNTFRLADYPKTEDCEQDVNCGLERDVNPRLFWQVPGAAKTNTGSSATCDATGIAAETCVQQTAAGQCTGWEDECDASFQRIYYANVPDTLNTECGSSGVMSTHYVHDSPSWRQGSTYAPPSAPSSYTDKFDHVGCEPGADNNQYWKGVSTQTLTAFGEGSSTSLGAGTCTQYHGGPTASTDDSKNYAQLLADWLQYPETHRDGSTLHTQRGKHCFQTNPCPETNEDNENLVLEKFYTVYPYVTCLNDGLFCNSGYYEDHSGDTPVAYGKYNGDGGVQVNGVGGENLRPYNPPQRDDTYCVPASS